MPQPWMKVELDTPDKLEIHQIAKTLNIDPDAVVGKLIRIWGWFNKNSIDGIEPLETISLLNRLVFNKNFCDAMVKVNWMLINKKQRYICIPNFDLHNSTGAKERALGSRRQEVFRIKGLILQELKDEKVTLTELLDKNKLEKIILESPDGEITEVYVPLYSDKEKGQ
jgi:hypothetical protein